MVCWSEVVEMNLYKSLDDAMADEWETYKFKNGSEIKVIPCEESHRSKRGEEQIQKMREYYNRNPAEFLEEMYGVKLFWWQKELLKWQVRKSK